MDVHFSFWIDDIAKRAGVSSRTIDNILSGNVTPNNDIADKIVGFIQSDDHKELIEKQTQRKSLYSWQKTAEQIQGIVQSI